MTKKISYAVPVITYECIYEWMNETNMHGLGWMHMSGRMNGWMDVDETIDVWMNEWMIGLVESMDVNELMNGWKNGRMNAWATYECKMKECMET